MVPLIINNINGSGIVMVSMATIVTRASTVLSFSWVPSHLFKTSNPMTIKSKGCKLKKPEHPPQIGIWKLHFYVISSPALFEFFYIKIIAGE